MGTVKKNVGSWNWSLNDLTVVLATSTKSTGEPAAPGAAASSSKKCTPPGTRSMLSFR